MAAGSSVATVPAAYTLVIERIFDAPRELVFKAWIDPAHLVHWLGSLNRSSSPPLHATPIEVAR